jgi:hypothetical protein
MRRRAFALFAGILVLGLMSGPVLAAGVVDQSNEAHPEGFSGQHLAQTVTVGQTGMLTGVDLFLAGNGWMDAVSIQTIDRVSRTPTGSELASATIWVSGEKWYHVEFPTPVSLIAGGRFAIVLSQGPKECNCLWKYSSGNYSGGEAFEYSFGAWNNLGGDHTLDYAFRTYMDPAVNPTAQPVPTPPPAPVVTAAPTQTPIPAATATPATTVPSASVATSELPASPTASIASAMPTALPDLRPGGSGDSGAPPIVLITVGIVALAAVLGGGIGLGFVLARRQRQ